MLNPGVAISPEGRERKAPGIKPSFARALVRWQIAVTDPVREVVENSSGIGGVRYRIDVECGAGLEVENTIDLPTVEHLPGHTAFQVLSERQFVAHAVNKKVADVENTAAAIQIAKTIVSRRFRIKGVVI